MKIYSKIDKGVVRNSNQDAYFAGEISQDVTFAVVCDGMGGANAGNVASGTAVKTISEYIIKSYRNNMSAEDISKMLKNAIISATAMVYIHSKTSFFKLKASFAVSSVTLASASVPALASALVSFSGKSLIIMSPLFLKFG